MSSQPKGPNPQVDQLQRMFNSLGQGNKIALIAAAVGLIVSFFPWYGASTQVQNYSISSSINGWHGWGLLAILAFLAAGALVILPLLGIAVRGLIPAIPPTITDARLLLGTGIVAAVAIVLYLLTERSGYSGPGYSEGPSLGAFLALICAVAIAYGGYLVQQQESGA